MSLGSHSALHLLTSFWVLLIYITLPKSPKSGLPSRESGGFSLYFLSLSHIGQKEEPSSILTTNVDRALLFT